MRKSLKTKNRVIALLMALLLVVGMAPSPTLAVSDGLQIVDPGANDVTVAPTSLQNGQIWTDKSVTYGQNGEFDITLKALGQDYKIENPRPIDLLDVVLVLDVSGSMGDSGKLASMKDAAKNAVTTLLGVVGNRVAVVKYSRMASLVSNFSTDAAYLNGNSVINGLSADGGTNIQNAFFVAEQTILNRSNKTRKPIIILMSDGEPTYYHNNFESQSESNRKGDGGNTSATHVWNTIKQAMHAKSAIADLAIYTIGFGVGSDPDTADYSVATLMPTEQNTASYRPTGFYGEYRKSVESAEFKYESSYYKFFGWSSYSLMNPIQLRNASTNTGNWFLYDGYNTQPSPSWTTPSKTGSKIGEVINDNYRTAYYLGSRTYTEYQTTANGKVPFNHKYWEEGSSITSDTAGALMTAFVTIINQLIISKPISHTENDEYSDITFTDVIGDGFEVVGTLPTGVTLSGNTLTWVIDGDDFKSMAPDSTSIDPLKVNQVSFKVKIKNTAGVGTFYTNASAQSSFSIPEDNPAFLASGVVVTPLTNKGWLTLTAPDVEATINITKTVTGPVSSEDRTFTFSIYSTATGGSPIGNPVSITVNGADSVTGSVKIAVPYSAFNGTSQATYYVQENEQTEPKYWTYDNDSRKPVTISRSNLSSAPVVFTNSYNPKGTLTVNKSWTGNGLHSVVSFDLQKETATAGVWENVSSGHTIAKDSTTGTIITDLLLGVNYRVVETTLQDYSTSYSVNSVQFSGSETEKSITITNDYKTPIGRITINKVWDDNDNAANDRPTELVFNVKGPTTDSNPTGTYSFTLTPTPDGDWSGVYETTLFGEYTFTEVVPKDYRVDVNSQSQTISSEPFDNRSGSLTFTNTYVTPTGTLKIRKIWADENKDKRFRPETITLNVFKDGGTEPVRVVTLPEEDSTPWTANLTELELGTYTAVEEDVPDYTTTYSSSVTLSKEDREGKITVTNTFDNPTGSITVTKNWIEGGIDEAVVRPSIIIELLKDGVVVGSFIPEGDSDSETFNDLALKGTYTVRETATGEGEALLANYAQSVTPSSITLSNVVRDGSISLTNTYAKGTIAVIKNWEDGNNPDLERPQTATVSLYQVNEVPLVAPKALEVDTELETQTVEPLPVIVGTQKVTTLIGTKTITRPATAAVFYGLEMGDNIEYYVTEETIPYYTTSFSDDADDADDADGKVVLNANDQNAQITVTNTYADPKGSLTVTKEWIHGNNPSPQPEVTVNLLKNDTIVDTKTFAESYTFVGLELGAVYTIEEITPSNYSADYNDFISYVPTKGDSTVPSGSATITNTYIPEKGNLLVSKEWVGKTGAPVDITVTRTYGDATDTEFIKTITLNSENNWAHTFTGLELYGPGGVSYRYSATEAGADLVLYTASNLSTPTLSVRETAEINIVNTYTPNKGELTIIKDWKDLVEESNDEMLSYRVSSIYPEVEVRLLIDGVPEAGTMILNSDNSWTVKRSGLDVEKTYSVEEVTRFEEYDVSYSSTSLKFTAQDLKETVSITNQRTEDKPAISVTKTALNPTVQLSNGSATFNYSLNIVNTGNRTLRGITVTDLVTKPSGSTAVYTPAPYFIQSNGSADFYLDGSLAPGASKVFTYSVTVNTAGTYNNLAIVSAYTRTEQRVTAQDDASTTATTPSIPNDPQGSVNVNYVDEAGVTLSPSYQFSSSVGSTYSTASRTIEGYTLTTVPTNASGTIISGSITVTYIYALNKVDVIDEVTPEEPVVIDQITTEEISTEEILEEILPQEVVPAELPDTSGVPTEILFALGSGLAGLGIVLKRKNK